MSSLGKAATATKREEQTQQTVCHALLVTRHDSARGRHEEARVNQLQTVQREAIMLSSRFCPADISLVVESPGAVFFVACEAMLEACNS